MFTFFYNLFFTRKFILHRVVGLIYLIQWFSAVGLYFFNTELYLKSFLSVTIPITGWLQAVTAAATFKFLPKTREPGYYTDKAPLSYHFVLENVFFSGLLMFAWIYMRPDVRGFLSHNPLGQSIEAIMVFLPYLAIREPFFVKTSFRVSLDNSHRNKTAKNFNFFVITTWITRIFYIFAKHYLGFLINYCLFLNLFNPDHTIELHGLYISSAAATNISMFLHTLKFKGHIGPKTSMSLYIISYLLTLISIYQISPVFVAHWPLTLICFLGLCVNFLPGLMWQWMYQIGVMMLLWSHRQGYSSPLSRYIFA